MGDFHQSNLEFISQSVENFCDKAKHIIMEQDFDSIDALTDDGKDLIDKMDEFVIDQLKRLKKNKSGAKNSKLFLDIMSETKTMILNLISLTKSVRDLHSDI
jgi:Na+/phosphate symporter